MLLVSLRPFAFAFAPKHHNINWRLAGTYFRYKRMSPPLLGVNNISRSEVSTTVSAIAVGEHHDVYAAETMKPTAKLVAATSQSLTECGARVRSGHLVSFPTETVYGLGCHALDPVAVQCVFDAKERPLSDPLIVHVAQAEQALELWDASSSTNEGNQSKELENRVLQVLTSTFFPGPLTIVAQAKPSVPQIIMANTGYVACRSPSHPIARALISYAQCPIAAPSANKFGHVSPTLAKHVMDDLGEEDVWIVDPSLGSLDKIDKSEHEVSGDNTDNAVCQVGVESTVAKVQTTTDNNNGKSLGCISILRHGAISSNSIREALKKANLDEYFEVKDSVQYTPENVNNVAPGQTVKHYSPHVPCFMISLDRQRSSSVQLLDEETAILAKSVIIDYAGKLSHYKQYALAYRDLSSSGDAKQAAANVFETLRWTESVEGAIRVFVPDLSSEVSNVHVREEDALVLAVKDKLTRAASGVTVGVFQ
jgi:tRNA threonylcarbamoyl adenosine modification protein (Sua5/YciO/YrdC/YwlC family)